MSVSTMRNLKKYTFLEQDLTISFSSDGKLRQLKEFSGEKHVTITARLSRGIGYVAWQHTQLFRQRLQDKNEFPFVIKVILKK